MGDNDTQDTAGSWAAVRGVVVLEAMNPAT